MKYAKVYEEFVNEIETGDNSFELVYPGTYTAKWTVSDAPCDENTIAKKFDFSILVEHPDSAIVGTTIKDSFTMAFSKDSRGIYSLGKDIEKYMGVPEVDAIKNVESGKESKNDALIYGLCNIMNGGKDIYFWNNGLRIGGAAEYAGPMIALVEQISHEAGVHLNRLVLCRHLAKQEDISIESEDWVTHDWGAGEYTWPAVGDLNDKNPLIKIDEETFATIGGAIVSILLKEFLAAAGKYIPNVPKI